MSNSDSKSKVVTVSLLLKDISADAEAYGIPVNTRDNNVIRHKLLDKYKTNHGILECTVDKERFILQWHPDSFDKKAENYHNEAIGFIKKKQYEGAIARLEEAISLNKSDVEYLYKLGLVYFEMKNFKDSVKYLERAVTICPIHYRSHLLLGINWIKLRDINKAEKHVLESNHLNRSNIRTYLNLGAIYSIQKRYNEAIEMFNTSIQLSPAESRAYLGMARIYMMLNDTEAANSYFKKVVELSPSTQMAEYAKRSIKASSREESDADTIDRTEDQISKGAGFYLTGDYSVSSRKYKEYLNLHPSDDYAWYLLGETKLRTGELNESADCFKRAIRLNAGKGLYHKSLGIVYHYLNKSKDVLDSLKKAMELGKKDALCWTLQGLHLVQQKKIEPAINAFNMAMKKNPNNPLVMYSLALAYMKNKRTKEAIELLKTILSFEYFVPIKNQAKQVLRNLDVSS